MSLPIVIIFERHWDTVPKNLLRDLLPGLAEKGYDTLCFEASEDLSAAEILARHNEGLEFDTNIEQQAERFVRQVGITAKLSSMSFDSLKSLMEQYVSSKKYVDIAEKIKNLPASRILKGVFEEAAALSISVKGIDICSKDLGAILSINLLKRMDHFRANEDYRIRTLFENLFSLQTQGKGIIFLCGALHADGLLTKFKERNIHDGVVYYFPHSSSRFDTRVDEIPMLTANDTLKQHTYLLAEQEVKPFSSRIIKEVTSKIKYQKEIVDDNSHSQFLSEYFNANFRSFLRPGYYVDALVNIGESSNIESIRNDVNAVGCQTHEHSFNGERYLVISGVNVAETAKKIRFLPSK